MLSGPPRASPQAVPGDLSSSPWAPAVRGPSSPWSRGGLEQEGQAWVRWAGGGAGGRRGGRRGDGVGRVPLPIAGRGPPGRGPCNETDVSVSVAGTWPPGSHGNSLHIRSSARSRRGAVPGPMRPRCRPRGCKPAPPRAPCHGAAQHPGGGDGCCSPTASMPLRSQGICCIPPFLPTQHTPNRLQSPGSSAPVPPHTTAGCPGRRRDAWSWWPAACGTWHSWEHVHHCHCWPRCHQGRSGNGGTLTQRCRKGVGGDGDCHPCRFPAFRQADSSVTSS